MGCDEGEASRFQGNTVGVWIHCHNDDSNVQLNLSRGATVGDVCAAMVKGDLPHVVTADFVEDGHRHTERKEHEIRKSDNKGMNDENQNQCPCHN